MPTQQRPPFAPPMPEAPAMPATAEEPPASLGEQATRLAVVGSLLFAVPTWLAVVWGFAIWIGGWVFVVFAPLGLAVIGAGLCVFAAPLWDQVQGFRYKQLHRRQDHYHRGLIVQTQVWLLRLHGLATYHPGPRLDPDAARIAGIPVYANGRPVWKGRVVDMPLRGEKWHSADPGANSDSSGDYPEDAPEPDQDTRQLSTPAGGWSPEMIALYNIRRPDGTCPLPYAKARGVSQPKWAKGMDGFRQRGLLVERPGTATRILG